MDYDVEEMVNQMVGAIQGLSEEEQVQKLKGYAAAIGSDTPLSETGCGLAAAVKCLKASSLVKHGVMEVLEAGINNKKANRLREGTCVAVTCLAQVLKALFEPYAVKLLPGIVLRMGDKVREVQPAAEAAFATIMANLSAHGWYAVMPVLGDCLCNNECQWQSKVKVLEAIRRATSAAKTQVSRCSSQIVPAVIESLTDTKSEVQQEAERCLKAVGKELIASPEMVAMVDPMVAGVPFLQPSLFLISHSPCTTPGKHTHTHTHTSTHARRHTHTALNGSV